MEKHQGHVLAIAGQAVMGKTGFILLGSAAMLATASAVNATLFGDANLGFDMSKKKELPGIAGKGALHRSEGRWCLNPPVWRRLRVM